MEDVNPWRVEDLHVFAFFCCPECTFRAKDESPFEIHALENHPQSSILFESHNEGEAFMTF